MEEMKKTEEQMKKRQARNKRKARAGLVARTQPNVPSRTARRKAFALEKYLQKSQPKLAKLSAKNSIEEFQKKNGAKTSLIHKMDECSCAIQLKITEILSFQDFIKTEIADFGLFLQDYTEDKPGDKAILQSEHDKHIHNTKQYNRGIKNNLRRLKAKYKNLNMVFSTMKDPLSSDARFLRKVTKTTTALNQAKEAQKFHQVVLEKRLQLN